MSRTFDYLVYFSVYSLIILIIGKSSFARAIRLENFLSENGNAGSGGCFAPSPEPGVSAATILGYTGNVFENGTSVIAVTVIPWFIGALLYLISGRIGRRATATCSRSRSSSGSLPFPPSADLLCPAALERLRFLSGDPDQGIWNRGGDALKY
ncbi:MAG: hypothetical protein ACLR8P_20385 [Clostridium fessum]